MKAEFSYRVTAAGLILVAWRGREVSKLSGPKGQELAAKLAAADPDEVQALLARATGNFKRGNEGLGWSRR